MWIFLRKVSSEPFRNRNKESFTDNVLLFLHISVTWWISLAYVSSVSHYKVIVFCLYIYWRRVRVCVWRDSEKGDHVHVGDMGRVWWWKSGLTGLTPGSLSCWFSFLFFILSSDYSGFRQVLHFQIGKNNVDGNTEWISTTMMNIWHVKRRTKGNVWPKS